MNDLGDMVTRHAHRQLEIAGIIAFVAGLIIGAVIGAVFL
jgi:hypothetical protein